ncbi:MAG TPA: ankyrin repeat domain-containing protein [Pyrinomonadaceae bacterium]|nr:ankyrin repeat domain-containing protein [Pyrinomonadaceae bacterium]
MNKFIKAVKDLDLASVTAMIEKDPKWLRWSEPDGKNALHYLCGTGPSDDPTKGKIALDILKYLIAQGMDLNSIQKIAEKDCHFPATPLWYAYTRGRNEKLYKYLLKQGADPSNCWWAIAWYDDVAAGKLWIKHGAKLGERPTLDELFLGSFQWKKYKFAQWLLDRGADVNARGPHQLTALMLAVKRKDEDAIAWLLKRGADPDLVNDAGNSARTIAQTKGPKRIAERLAFTKTV